VNAAVGTLIGVLPMLRNFSTTFAAIELWRLLLGLTWRDGSLLCLPPFMRLTVFAFLSARGQRKASRMPLT
jgi:hypothetical protein